MNFVNKAALREFPLSNVLLLNQMMLALLILPTLKVKELVQCNALQSVIALKCPHPYSTDVDVSAKVCTLTS